MTHRNYRDPILVCIHEAQESRRMPLTVNDLLRALDLPDGDSRIVIANEVLALRDSGYVLVAMPSQTGTTFEEPMINALTAAGVTQVLRHANTIAGILVRFNLWLAERHQIFTATIDDAARASQANRLLDTLSDHITMHCKQEILRRVYEALRITLAARAAGIVNTVEELLWLFNECLLQSGELPAPFFDVMIALETIVGSNPSLEYATGTREALLSAKAEGVRVADSILRGSSKDQAESNTQSIFNVTNYGSMTLQAGSSNVMDMRQSTLDVEQMAGLLRVLGEELRSCDNASIAELARQAEREFAQHRSITQSFGAIVQMLSLGVQTLGALPAAYPILTSIAHLANIALPALPK
jgi:hypothetical protein